MTSACVRRLEGRAIEPGEAEGGGDGGWLGVGGGEGVHGGGMRQGRTERRRREERLTRRRRPVGSNIFYFLLKNYSIIICLFF